MIKELTIRKPLTSSYQVLKMRKKIPLKRQKNLPTAMVNSKLNLNSKLKVRINVSKRRFVVRSTKLCPHQSVQLLATLTVIVIYPPHLFAQPQLLSMLVDLLRLLRLTTNRFLTNSTRLMQSVVGTKAPQPTKFTTRLMLELTLSPSKVALQSKSSTTNSQATADRVARRRTLVLTKNREFRWQTILLVLTPIHVCAQLTVLQSALQLAHQSVPQLTAETIKNLKYNSSADYQA